MPNVYVRTLPKSQLKTRHRAGMGFTDQWQEIEVDMATLNALNQDPYLEVSETPTVMVEVDATTTNNPPESDADANEGSTGKIANDDSVDAGAVEAVMLSADQSDVSRNSAAAKTETGNKSVKPKAKVKA